ncbi:MAG: NADH-quinone oxidoreductase subunit L [Planctomycetota bacterium]|nr:NADH-quinone oxidoreductase subunit L [Planctomycetota bacterium]
MDNSLWLMPALPFLGSIVCGILHALTLRQRKADPSMDASAPGIGALAAPVAVLAMVGSFIVAVMAWSSLKGLDVAARAAGIESSVWHWIDLGPFAIDLSMVVDPLSAVMILVITGVGLLIHIYSSGYIKGDPGFAKFFAYLNLFVAMMLILVLSSNLVGLFVGWEGVGLCSYLLIGFWYDKGWPAEAGQKAFVVNRIGDACFLIGAFLLVRLFGTLDASDIAASVITLIDDPEKLGTMGLAALLLFGGACGKSAQFPLLVWLPDAMAGPTPVSALIHAATMVTAGVYLVVRLNPLFAAAPTVMLVIGIVGALTAFIGATSALRQTDIKKVLAYSTVSQLGYMFLGLATGAWAAAVFHLVTHAFFKGLLFLGSGSVIHGMHHEQDMTKMGGLKKHMPKTFLTFLAGAAALSGLPLMSGFFSKDEILFNAFGMHGAYYGLWAVGLVSAMLTAFYTWRMVALTFFGKERFDVDHVHPHESPATMWVPLAILAVASVFGGLLNLPAVISKHPILHTWLQPVTEKADAVFVATNHVHEHASHAVEWGLLGLGALVALVFSHLGFRRYKDAGPAPDTEDARRMPGLTGFLGAAWRLDGLYEAIILIPVRLIAQAISALIDKLVVDGAVNGAGAIARLIGDDTRKMTTGSVKSYAVWMGFGAAALSLLLIWI